MMKYMPLCIIKVGLKKRLLWKAIIIFDKSQIFTTDFRICFSRGMSKFSGGVSGVVTFQRLHRGFRGQLQS